MESGRATPDHDGSARKPAGVAFVLAAAAVIVSFGLAMSEPGYENPAFVYLHAGLFLATVFTAVGVTALLHAVGVRRLGVAGVLGGAFSWIAVSSGPFWLMIAWMTGVAAAVGSSSLGDLVTILSPMGTGLFAVTGIFAPVGLGATAIDLRDEAVVHRVLAGVSVLPGVVGGVLFLALALLFEPTVLEALILLAVLAWLWTLPLGIALVRGTGRDAPADEAGDAASA